MEASRMIRYVVVLLGLILSIGLICNYQYTKNLNESYRSLLEKESKEFQAFQSITFQASNIQRALLNIAIVNPAEYQIWDNKIVRGQARIDSQFNCLELLASNSSEKTHIEKLRTSYNEYRKEYSDLLQLLLAENFEGTHQNVKIKQIGASYEAYMKQQKAMLGYIRQNINDQSTDLENKSIHLSQILLFFGSLPYLLVILTVLISLFIVFWLVYNKSGIKIRD